MEKCWFVLEQSHFPLPDAANGGPLRLGHIIPAPKALDHVLNPDGPLPLPLNMPEYTVERRDFEWHAGGNRDAGVEVDVKVPIAETLGMVAPQAGVGGQFARTVSGYWRFEQLESRIIQPTAKYVQDSMKDAAVVEYLRKSKLSVVRSPSVYMVTGIMIAHGASHHKTHASGSQMHGGPGVSLALGTVEANAILSHSGTTMSSLSFGSATDFVWAVRLAKITKGILCSEWKHATLSKGSVLSIERGTEAEDGGDRQRVVCETLAINGVDGLNKDQVITDEGTVLVVF